MVDHDIDDALDGVVRLEERIGELERRLREMEAQMGRMANKVTQLLAQRAIDARR